MSNANLTLLYGIIGALFFLALGAVLGLALFRRNPSQPPARLARPRTARNSERDRMRAVYNLTASLINTLNYERVLEIALDMATTAFAEPGSNSQQLVSAVLLFDEDELVVKSARRFTNADLRQALPGETGGIGEAITNGEPGLVPDPIQDPEVGRIVALRTCKSAYVLPLRSGLDIYGVMLFGHPRGDFFNADNCEILEIIASQAISAMQNARLYQELEQEKERMAEAQEEARRKLARDLHDGPTQSVSAIAMRINFARHLMERDPDEAAEEMFRIEDLARQTTKEIRHMLFTLRPLVLESQGLAAALKAMAEKMEETYDQKVLLEVDENTVDVLDMGKLGVIFYVIEEAVTNARKHAQASHIWVRLKSVTPDIALVDVRDNGVGFDVDRIKSSYDSRGSLGLVNLQDRADLVNGVLQIDSRPGHGTKIQVYIPITEAGADTLWKRK